MKKINVFLIILILVLGGYLAFKQLNPKPIVVDQPSQATNSETTNSQTNTDSTTDNKDAKDTKTNTAVETNNIQNNSTMDQQKQPDSNSKNNNSTKVSNNSLNAGNTGQKIIISEEDLIKQVKNKNYLESTYMALEYSKVNNKQLMDTLKSYTDNNSNMKPEEVMKLIDIHEKTFLNRYLKVFVTSPDSNLYDLNSDMRRIFYQMKAGFDTLDGYQVKEVSQQNNQDGKSDANKEDQNKQDNKPATKDTSKNKNSQSKSSTTTSKEKEPQYDVNNIRKGLEELESVSNLVDDALEKLGNEDIAIESVWLQAGLTEKDITNVIDKTNGTLPVMENNVTNVVDPTKSSNVLNIPDSSTVNSSKSEKDSTSKEPTVNDTNTSKSSDKENGIKK